MIRRVLVRFGRGMGRDDRGSVAAEFAVALPAVLLVLALGVGAVSAQGQRVLLQDGVADAARLLARGEDLARATAAVTAAVPQARVESAHDGDRVCVVASASVPLIAATTITLSARSCALGGGL